MIEDFSFLLRCPECEAIFWPENGILMRLGTIPQETCFKCLEVQQQFAQVKTC